MSSDGVNAATARCAADTAYRAEVRDVTETREVRELVACQLLHVPGMTPRRAKRLLDHCGVQEVMEQLANPTHEVCERMEVPPAQYRPHIAKALGRGERDYQSLRSMGASIWLPGDARWEVVFNEDRWPPIALFALGDLTLINRPRVGIVGTRSASPGGREIAHRFGRELAELGIAVVSGLAFGIDASAHAGALATSPATPIGVVGTGLDVPYPRQNTPLWNRVAKEGLLLSEYLPGTRPTQFSFPERNRIIAALSEVLVIVESNASGGSLITVRDAWERNRQVLAVPGSPLNKACEGSNELLRKLGLGPEKVMPCLSVSDVLTVLALDHAVKSPELDFRRAPGGVAATVLHELGWEQASTATLITRTGLSPAAIAMALGELENEGWATRVEGLWHQIPAGSACVQ